MDWVNGKIKRGVDLHSRDSSKDQALQCVFPQTILVIFWERVAFQQEVMSQNAKIC